jgi:hypothetical protein
MYKTESERTIVRVVCQHEMQLLSCNYNKCLRYR